MRAAGIIIALLVIISLIYFPLARKHDEAYNDVLLWLIVIVVVAFGAIIAYFRNNK